MIFRLVPNLLFSRLDGARSVYGMEIRALQGVVNHAVKHALLITFTERPS